MARRPISIPVLMLASLALVACGGGKNNLDSLDGELMNGNGTDPALAEALQDQIMVDPTLGGQANGDSVRPPGRPYASPMPATDVAANGNPPARLDNMLSAPPPITGEKCTQCGVARESITLGALAERQKNGRTSGCAANLDYSADWANRLPPDLPLYPQARVSEAADTTKGSCALRVVSFSTSAPMQLMLDWYYTKAIRAGYTAEHQADGSEHVLGGTRTRDDGAYVLFMTPRQDGGTDIDLVANNGV